MEKSILEFVRGALSDDPDYTKLTKAELRSRYLKEKGLAKFNKEEKKLFSNVVNKVLIEFADAIVAKSDTKKEAAITKQDIQTISSPRADEEVPTAMDSNISFDRSLSPVENHSVHNGDSNLSDNVSHKEDDNSNSSEIFLNLPVKNECVDNKMKILSKKNNLDTEEKISAVFDSLDTSDSDSEALVIMEEPENSQNSASEDEFKVEEKDSVFKEKSSNLEKNSCTVPSDSSEDDFRPKQIQKKKIKEAKSNSLKSSSRITRKVLSDDDEEEAIDSSSCTSTNKIKINEEVPTKKRKSSSTGRSRQPKKIKASDKDLPEKSSSEDEILLIKKNKRSDLKETSTKSNSSQDNDDSNKNTLLKEEKKSEKSNILHGQASNEISSEDENLAVIKERERERKAKLAEEGEKENSEDDVDDKSNTQKSEKSGSSKIRKQTSDTESQTFSSSESDEAEEKKESKKKKKNSQTKANDHGSKNTKKESKNSASNARIERLKKYLRAAGIHVQSYNKLWENCKTQKSKMEKLLELLQKEGLKGRPTLEKCKKLKKKIEKKKEIEELDVSNIIKTNEGRPKRNTRSLYLAGETTEPKQENPGYEKHFELLRDLVESDDDDLPASAKVQEESVLNGNSESIKRLLDSDDEKCHSAEPLRKISHVKSIIDSD